MGDSDPQSLGAAAWSLARRQHGVVSWWQLLELGFSPKAIKHRVANGRLHPIYRGVYAVGRPELTQYGRWMAAVLRCGPHAYLSHGAPGALLRIRPEPRRGGGLATPIDISLNAAVFRQAPGIRIHRRPNLTPDDLTTQQGIPTTTPIRTLIDLATRLPANQLERAVNQADKLDLVDPETLRTALEERKGQRGVRPLRTLLDRHTFRLTDSELERRFLLLSHKAGLPPPLTQQRVNGYRVDFKSVDPSHAPELGLVVETDGLRYHRTPAQQTTDHRREQAHAASGLERLRFSHAQIRFEPEYVMEMLAGVARRIASRP